MIYYRAFAYLATLALCTEAFYSQHQAFVPRTTTGRPITTKPAFVSVLVDSADDEPFSESTICVPVSPSTPDVMEPEAKRPRFLQRIFGRKAQNLRTKALELRAKAANGVSSLEERLDRRQKKVELDIKRKAQEIKTKATNGLAELEDRLDRAIQKQTDEIINDIAIDCVRVLNGRWDVAIATDKDDTRTMMEGSIEELADELIDMGVAEESEKNLLKQDLSNSRLKMTQVFDGSDYPLRMKHEISLGSQPAVQFYGQLQFDLLEHKALYSLDELVVLGTKVDLDEIIRSAEEAEMTAEAEGEGEEEPSETEETLVADALLATEAEAIPEEEEVATYE